MPFVSGSYQKNIGVIFDVFVIRHHKIAADTVSSSKRQVAGISAQPYRALLDTGASATCISSKVVKEVGLESIGLGKMVSASGVNERKRYFFSLGVPIIEKINPVSNEAAGRIHGFPPIQGYEFHTEQNANFDILLGMDIITNGCFKVESDGHFSFWF